MSRHFIEWYIQKLCKHNAEWCVLVKGPFNNLIYCTHCFEYLRVPKSMIDAYIVEQRDK